MTAKIAASTEFWMKQKELDAAATLAEATAHMDMAHMYLSKKLTNLANKLGITDHSTDADCIDALVKFIIANYWRIEDRAKAAFDKHAAEYGLVDAIAWHAADVAAEAGRNELVTRYLKMVRAASKHAATLSEFLEFLAADRDELIANCIDVSPASSTSMGHNLVDTYKHAGERRILTGIIRMVEELSKVQQLR